MPPDDERVIPEELKILIRVLLSTDKSKRPSCDDILSTLSHQRDRMMHGDMDSPTTPIVSSSSSSHAVTGKVEIESENDTVRDDVSESTISQHLHSVPHRHASLGRRRSRVTLVTEPSSRSAHRGRSPGAVRCTTASPSINLHRKVKPLGLGLRHLLRRKTMHFPSTGVYRSPKITSSADNEGSMSLSIRGSPSSTGIPTTGSPAVTQFNAQLFQRQQNIRERQIFAKTRESALGLAVRLPDSKESPGELYGHLDQIKGKASGPVSLQGPSRPQPLPISSTKSVPRSNSNSSSSGRKKHPRDVSYRHHHPH